MAIGDIVRVIDSLEFDGGPFGAATFPVILHVAGNVYAIAYQGPDNDGWLKTVTINNDGTTLAVVDSLEFDPGYGLAPAFIHISGNVFAMAYGGLGNDGWLKTISIADDGTIGAEINSFEFDPVKGTQERFLHISGDIYAIVYRDTDSYGQLFTITIQADGTIGAIIDSLEFDPASGLQPKIIHISGNVYAIAYKGADSDGWLCTVSIETNGQIGDAVIATLEFDPGYGDYPDIVHISGNTYAIAYQGPDSDGWLCTVSISEDGTTLSVINSFEFDPDLGSTPIIIPIAGDVYTLAYHGPDSDGWLKTLTIQADGTIGVVTSSLELDPEYCSYLRSYIHIAGNVYAIPYLGPDLNGWLKTVEITTPVAPRLVINKAFALSREEL